MDMEKKTGRKLGKKGMIGLTLALVLLVALAVGGASGAFGLLKDTTGSVTAAYTTPTVDCEVTETGTGAYAVTNTGTTRALIRARIVMNWTDGTNVVYAPGEPFPVPAVSAQWTLIDGCYYYNGVTEPGDSLNFFTVETEGFAHELQVVVLAEAIQSEPETAAADAWGLVYKNNAWTQPTP